MNKKNEKTNNINNTHKAFTNECFGSDKIVIFIHGFMGSPNQFADLAKTVYEAGCSYTSILLPGHGSGYLEFVKNGITEWEEHLQAQIEAVKGNHNYDKIYLAGHSMGGLLALNASCIGENKIAGVFMLSTPLKVRLFSFRAFLARVKLLAYKKEHEIKTSYFNANSIPRVNVFAALLVLKPVINFYRLVGRTRRRLGEVFVPVCMVHSKNDETTAYKSAKLLRKGLCNTKCESVVLDESWHAYYNGEERKVISDKLIEFIR